MTAQEQSARSILAAKLREYRQRAGLTVYQVGEYLGKSGKTVSAWETGHGQPDAEVFVKLYKLYNMESMSDFYGIKDEETPNDEVELLEAYRALNATGKKMLLANAKSLAKSGDYSSEEE